MHFFNNFGLFDSSKKTWQKQPKNDITILKNFLGEELCNFVNDSATSILKYVDWFEATFGIIPELREIRNISCATLIADKFNQTQFSGFLVKYLESGEQVRYSETVSGRSINYLKMLARTFGTKTGASEEEALKYIFGSLFIYFLGSRREKWAKDALRALYGPMLCTDAKSGLEEANNIDLPYWVEDDLFLGQFKPVSDFEKTVNYAVANFEHLIDVENAFNAKFKFIFISPNKEVLCNNGTFEFSLEEMLNMDAKNAELKPIEWIGSVESDEYFNGINQTNATIIEQEANDDCNLKEEIKKQKTYAIDRFRDKFNEIGFDKKRGGDVVYDKKNKHSFFYNGPIGKKYDLELEKEGMFPVLPVFDKISNKFNLSDKFISDDEEIILIDNSLSIRKYGVGNIKRSLRRKISDNAFDRFSKFLNASINPSDGQNAERVKKVINQINNEYGFNLDTGMFVLSDKGFSKGRYSVSFAKKKEDIEKESVLLV